MSRWLKEEVLAWYYINISLLLFFTMWCHLWTGKIPLRLVGHSRERMVRDLLFYSSKPFLRWMETKLMDHFCWSRDLRWDCAFSESDFTAVLSDTALPLLQKQCNMLHQTVATLGHRRFQDSFFLMTLIYLSDKNAKWHRNNWKCKFGTKCSEAEAQASSVARWNTFCLFFKKRKIP